MKMRTDFVTNSSSSSYCTIRVDAPKLAEIVTQLYEMAGVELPDSDDFESMLDCDAPLLIDGNLITEVPAAEDSPFTGAPRDTEDAVSMIVTAVGESMGNAGYDYESIKKHLSELEKQSDDLVSDVRSIEWDYYDSEWGGDSDARFAKGYYPPADLKKILKDIAEEQGCAPEDVTDEVFEAYVGPKHCNTHESFRFDKASGNAVSSRSVTIE